PSPVIVAAPQDVQQRPVHEFGPVVGLREVTWPHPRTEAGDAAVSHRLERGAVDGLMLRVRVGAAAREQPQEMRLARAVRPEHGDAVAVPDLEVERVGQILELQLLADHRSLPRTATGEAHPDVLFLRSQLRWAGLLEPAQPGLRGLVAGGHAVVVGGLLLVHGDEVLELLVLLVPATALLVQPLVPCLAGRVPGREAARVGPGGAAL